MSNPEESKQKSAPRSIFSFCISVLIFLQILIFIGLVIMQCLFYASYGELHSLFFLYSLPLRIFMADGPGNADIMTTSLSPGSNFPLLLLNLFLAIGIVAESMAYAKVTKGKLSQAILLSLFPYAFWLIGLVIFLV